MGNLFQALSSGLARFVYAWLLPSVLTVAVFALVVWPQLDVQMKFGAVGVAATLTLAAMGVSVGFAYGSRPLFQFFEGYSMPAWLARPLLRRQQRAFLRLRAQASRAPSPTDRALATDQLRGYPDSLEMVLPTRMGNALKGMETYGVSRYGLDSQTFWFELQSTSDAKVWRGVEETRAAVDFFMSSMTHLLFLASVCLVVSPWCANPAPVLVTAGACLVASPVVYGQTVTNIVEWRFAVQALVNLSRPALATGMGLKLPTGFVEERRMWESARTLVVHGPDAAVLHRLNPLRLAPTPAPEADTPSG